MKSRTKKKVVVALVNDHWLPSWLSWVFGEHQKRGIPSKSINPRSTPENDGEVTSPGRNNFLDIEYFDVGKETDFEDKVAELECLLLKKLMADEDVVCFAPTDSCMILYSVVVGRCRSLYQNAREEDFDNSADNTYSPQKIYSEDNSLQKKTVSSEDNSRQREKLARLRGCSFPAFFLCTHKLAGRELIRGLDGLQCLGVRRSDEFIPEFSSSSSSTSPVRAFFKPVDGVGSQGVFLLDDRRALEGEVSNDHLDSQKNSVIRVRNPLHRKFITNPASREEGEEDEVGPGQLEEEEEDVPAGGPPKSVRQLALQNEACAPYVEGKKSDIVGVVEEYVPPNRSRKFCVDGFVEDGAVRHYVISENIYRIDDPNKFDCIVTPAENLTKGERAALWARFDEVVGDLSRNFGLDRQFVDVESFLIYEEDEAEGNNVDDEALLSLEERIGDVAKREALERQAKYTPRAEVMEVNCRTPSNQMAVYVELYGRERAMGPLALDLLFGKKIPEFPEGFGLPGWREKNESHAHHESHADEGLCEEEYNSTSTAGRTVTSSTTESTNPTTRKTTTSPLYAVSAYVEPVPGLKPGQIVRGPDGLSWFYASPPPWPQHVYVYGDDVASCRARCAAFRDEVLLNYSRGGKEFHAEEQINISGDVSVISTSSSTSEKEEEKEFFMRQSEYS